MVEPTEQFYVADYANVLQQDTKDDIVEKNAVLYEQTGAQIVVVTVDFLDGMAIEDYALELFNEWGDRFGRKEQRRFAFARHWGRKLLGVAGQRD